MSGPLLPLRALRHDERVQSVSVSPHFRKYRRTRTVAAEACVKTLVEAYVGAPRDKLRSLAIAASSSIMQSNGRLMPAAPVRADRYR